MTTRERKRVCSAAYNAAHKEERRAYDDAHKEEICARQASYYATHREEKRVYMAEYRDAHKEEIRERHAKQREWFTGNLRILKAAQGCTDCGTHQGTLDYHHLDPSTKKYNVSRMQRRSLESWVDEVAKCAVLCQPCHNKRHAEMKQEEVPA